MTSASSARRPWARRSIAIAGIGVAGLVAGTLPASAHPSFAAAAGFGFLPNTAGGTGAVGSTPPYNANTTVTSWLRVPFEQTAPYNGSDDTTVDIKVVVPAGFTSPVCGTANKQINDNSTNSTNQPGAVVAGWSCEILTVDSHQVIHYAGPQVVAPVTAADSVQFVSFDITTPAPTTQTTYNGTGGTEGFILDQQYASGETEHWIPNAAYTGTAPPGSTTTVATGLARTVAGPGTFFHPIDPVRILDSRGATGGWAAPLNASTPKDLTVTGGTANVPADVDAVILNVTVTGGTTNSFLTVYPTGGTVPTASNLNFATGQTTPNLVTVKVGAGGKVSFNNALGAVDVVADLVGYYSPTTASKFNALAPVRVLDSRGATGGWTGPLQAGTPNEVHIRGENGVSASADSVVVNVTATGGTANSFLTVYPSDATSVPNVSNLNFAAGETIANLVVVKIGADGHIAFDNAVGAVHVIADVVGYYETSSGDVFHSLAPGRILDSRTTNGGWNAKLASGTPRTLQVTGLAGVRADATAVVGNATVTGGTANSYLTVYPNGQAEPTASNLNFAVGQTIPNLTSVKIGTGGKILFANEVGSTDVIYDVVGFFAAT